VAALDAAEPRADDVIVIARHDDYATPGGLSGRDVIVHEPNGILFQSHTQRAGCRALVLDAPLVIIMSDTLKRAGCSYSKASTWRGAWQQALR
jgi:hypothetical protein